MSRINKWLPGEFEKYLKEEWKLDIKKSTLEKHEIEGLLYPKREQNNYRYYFEKDILEVIKINVMNKYLGIKLKDVRHIEGIREIGIRKTRDRDDGKGGNLKPRYAKKTDLDPNHFYDLLHLPEQSDLILEVENRHIKEMLVNELVKYRNNHKEDWYGKVDWYALYQRCKTFVPKSQFSLNPQKVDQIVQTIIAKIDIKELIDEVNEQLRDEFYDSAVMEIEERYDLEEFDEDTSDPEIIDEFYQELQEWIDQYEEETVLVKMERFVDEEVAKVIEELSDKKIDNEVHDMFPELKEAIKNRLYLEYQEKRQQHLSGLSEIYETDRLVLNPIDMELLSIVFFGQCSFILYFSVITNEVEWYPQYVEDNYANIKRCSKVLLEKYGKYMKDGFETLYLIPGGEKTVLEEAARYIPIIYKETE